MMTWTWDYFFVPQNQPTPPDAAFGMFSMIHFAVLGILTAGIAVLVVAYTRADDPHRRTIRHLVGWTVLLLEVARQAATIASGHYTPEILPLHICAVATASIFIDSQWPNRWTGDFLYALGWWGALAADLFPDWTTRPILNVYTWQSFVIHALIFGYVLMRLVGRDFTPDVRNLPRVTIMMVVLGGVGALANTIWGTNFWFLNAGAPGSPLESIHTLTGAFYVPVLVVLLAIVWTGMYLPWELARRRAIRRSAATGTA